MDDGQKYVAGTPHATTNDQTVNSDPQTANQTLSEPQPEPEGLGEIYTKEERQALVAPGTTSVTVPLYLEQLIDSWESVEGFNEYLLNAFAHASCQLDFMRSGPFTERYNKAIATIDCYRAIIHRAAVAKLGPKPDKKIVPLKEDSCAPIQTQAHTEFMNNPYNYADLPTLQDWILRLQEMGQRATAIIARHQQIETAQDALIATYKEKAASQAEIIRTQKEIIDELRAELNLKEAQIPKAKQGCTLLLNTSNERGMSEVEFIQTVLTEHREDRMAAMLQLVKDKLFEEAFVEYQSIDQATSLLRDLTNSLNRLAHNNYLSANFTGQPDAYTRHKLWGRDMKGVKENYFYEELLGLSSHDEEETDEEPSPDPDPIGDAEADAAEAKSELKTFLMADPADLAKELLARESEPESATSDDAQPGN